MANVPKDGKEWEEFSAGFTDVGSAIILGAIGGGQFDVPLAAATGGYFPSVVCVAALIRNLADSVDIDTEEVIEDITNVLSAIIDREDD